MDRLLSSHARLERPEATEPGLGTGGFQGFVAWFVAVILMCEGQDRMPHPKPCCNALPLLREQAMAWGVGRAQRQA